MTALRLFPGRERSQSHLTTSDVVLFHQIVIQTMLQMHVFEEKQLKLPSVTSYCDHKFHSNERALYDSTVLLHTSLGTAHSRLHSSKHNSTLVTLYTTN